MSEFEEFIAASQETQARWEAEFVQRFRIMLDGYKNNPEVRWSVHQFHECIAFARLQFPELFTENDRDVPTVIALVVGAEMQLL